MIQGLDSKIPIVNPDGTPTLYLLQLLQGRGGNIQGAVDDAADALTVAEAAQADVDALELRNINTGIGLAGGGNLTADRTLTLNAGIDLLNDVDTSTTPPTNGQALVYNTASSLWKPGTVSGGSSSFRGCLVRKSADATGVNTSASYIVTFDTEEYDTDSIHSTTTNTSRLTVPSGVSKVRLSGMLYVSSLTASTDISAYIQKNGTAPFVGWGGMRTETDATDSYLGFTSAVINVSSGDYFEMVVYTPDTSINILSSGTWFQMEILG